MTPQDGPAEELHAIVYGDVQGVGFRFFVRRTARQMGLCGFVRNCHDGTVEVVAQGDRRLLEQFARIIRHGPPAANVSQVHLRWHTVDRTFGQFDIRM